MKERLSDLIEELLLAQTALIEANKENEEAREKYLDGGGMSWGYHGASYYDRVSEAEAKVREVKTKIDSLS